MYSLDQCSPGTSQVLQDSGQTRSRCLQNHPSSGGWPASGKAHCCHWAHVPEGGTDLGRGFAVLTQQVCSPSTPTHTGSHVSLGGDVHGHKSNMAPHWGPVGLGWMQNGCESYSSGDRVIGNRRGGPLNFSSTPQVSHLLRDTSPGNQ